jgi:DNA-binding protein
MADPMKYTSVSISNDNWKIATQLQSVVTRGATLSRAKVVEIALARLADELELDLVEVSTETLKQTNKEKHAS